MECEEVVLVMECEEEGEGRRRGDSGGGGKEKVEGTNSCWILLVCTWNMYIHTYIHTQIHTYIPTQMHTYMSGLSVE